LLLLFSGTSIAHGLCLPSSIVGAIGTDSRTVGLASSLVGCMQMAIGALLTQVVAHFLVGSAWPLLIGMAAVTWAGSLCYLLVLVPSRPRALGSV
jgi:DHA1 family bicyclomycin/chloramphenicol resistance-like MFS transporter